MEVSGWVYGFQRESDEAHGSHENGRPYLKGEPFEYQVAQTWCFKRIGKYQVRTVSRWRSDMQVFQHRKLVAHGHDDHLQIWKGYVKADAPHAIVVPEGKQNDLLISGDRPAMSVHVIDDKW